MFVAFPSLAYFAELKRLMEDERERFQRLGFIDVTFAVPSNTLTHLGSPIRVLYDDPEGHDCLFRYNESIQEFLNLSAKLDIAFSA